MTLTRMKEYWNAVAGRATTAIFVAPVLTAKLHAATSGPDDPVPNIFDPHSRPADAITFCQLGRKLELRGIDGEDRVSKASRDGRVQK